jgi:hypothetical protein
MNGREFRNIIIGKNSSLWQRLQSHVANSSGIFVEISHSDVGKFDFRKSDVVWILSYSKRSEENIALLRNLKDKNFAKSIYVSSATTNVCNVTHCYVYPSVKKLAADYAKSNLRSDILTIGVVVDETHPAPKGYSATTSIAEIFSFIEKYKYSGDVETHHLFKMEKREFENQIEERLYDIYGRMINLCGRFPCVLRPFDFLFRLLGFRWYGYLYLSNALWLSLTK